MKTVLIVLINLLLSCQSNIVKEIEQYAAVYEYLSRERPDMNLRVMDTIQHIGLTAFSQYVKDDLGFEGMSNAELIMHLDSLDQKNQHQGFYSSEVEKEFKSQGSPSHALYFSKPFRNYLLVELFDLERYNYGTLPTYERLTTMGESEQYLFVFGKDGRSIKEVHKLTVAYN